MVISFVLNFSDIRAHDLIGFAITQTYREWNFYIIISFNDALNTYYLWLYDVGINCRKSKQMNKKINKIWNKTQMNK